MTEDAMTEPEPVTRYFGPPQLRKEWEQQIDTPVGAVCLLCEELIDEDDTGTINYVGQVTHYECMMRSVLGSVGHLRGRCSCFGGDEEDPPGMTRREAAIAAVRLWESTQGLGGV
jgi:hypothetical protein